jgi:hypothetical protein
VTSVRWAFHFFDRDLDERIGEGRKRKRGEEENKERKGGLSGLPGWERRSRNVRLNDRWKRKVMRMEVKEDGNMARNEADEIIPVPESFDMGREEKGLEMNNSGRLRNNFGMNREGLFPVGQGMKSETRNWLASFMKAGCVSCRDENGVLNHKGRDGQPGVLIVGDEATPSTVGYTGRDKNDGNGDSCAWIIKVEHLGLEEVANLLRKVNLDKKTADRASGKREHDFFMAKGSKILVSSYVHLRKEGLEGYINDFNDMVKKVQVVTGNLDIEILPVVPVVREGMDQVGRELLAMVREWVEWIGVKSGRESVKRLSGTAGWGVESDGHEATFIWKPSFQMKVSEGNSE